jgi:hypothetical protein
MNKQNITPFAWGAVAGAIVLSIGMFASGWAVTSGAADRSAKTMTETAVVENLAKICIAQFEAAADKAEKLAALKRIDYWQRATYVNEQGWATMPGSESGTSQVASECAELLVKIQS